jgi:hypothetical protein
MTWLQANRAARIGAKVGRAERWTVAFLAALLGAGIVGYAVGPMPSAYFVSVVALPVGVLVAAATLVRTARYPELQTLLRRVCEGALWGVAAIGVYDLYKPLAKLIFGLGLDPYRAMPVFGHLLSGLPLGSDGALLLGWAYHLWIAAACGVIFALLRPRGGVAAGVAWGLLLQAARLVAYPELAGLLTVDAELLVIGIMGHALWGAVLGAGLHFARWRHA